MLQIDTPGKHRIKSEKKKSLDSHVQSFPSIIHKPAGFKRELNY